MIRLVPDQSTRIRRAPEVGFTFDGQPVQGRVGESVASALMRAGRLYLRDAPEGGGPRGAFCCMGLCQECVVRVDGAIVESCRLTVTPGLEITSLKRNGA
jgi:aerobic-type carbon monoxide dehydrogenase small subunit (CoxS/CutS family)